MEPGQDVLSLSFRCLDEQASYAHVKNGRKVLASAALPIDPHVSRCFNARAHPPGRGRDTVHGRPSVRSGRRCQWLNGWNQH